MDSQERAYVTGGQSAVRTAFGYITNYAKNPSFEAAGIAQVKMRNLAAYGSFETAQNGTTEVRRNAAQQPRGGTNWSNGGSASPIQVLTGGPDGGEFRRVTSIGTSGDLLLAETAVGDLQVTPGETRTLSIYGRAPAGKTLALRFAWLNAANGVVGPISLIGGVTATGDWQRFHYTTVVPATVVRASLGVAVPAGQHAVGDLLEASMVLCEQTDQLRPYFDGSTPDTKGFDYSWAGAENASASVARAAAVTVRENLFQNPLAFAAGTYFEAAATGADGSYITDFPGYGTAYRTTRVSEAAARIGIRSPLPSSTQITVVIQVNSSTPIPAVFVNCRSSTGSASGQADFGQVSVPAGRSEIRVTGVTPSESMAGSGSGIALVFSSPVIGATFDVTAIQFELGPIAGPFFAGSSPNSGDFINAWTGAANASTSVQQGVRAAGFTTNQAAAILSWDWKKAGSTSLRVVSISSGIGYAELSDSPLGATDLATLVVTARLPAPAVPSGSGRARSLTRLGVGETNSQAPNVAGEHVLRQVSSTGSRVLLYAGNSAGQGDMWYDGLTIMQGNHPDLMPFDGSSVATAPYYYAWDGTPFASTSTYSAPGIASITGGAQLTRPNGSKALLVAKGETVALDAAYYGMPGIVGFSSMISLEVAPYITAGGGGDTVMIAAGTMLARLTMDNGDAIELRNDEDLIAYTSVGGNNDTTQRVGWTMNIPSNRSVTSFQLMAPSTGNYSGILFDRLLVSRLQSQVF